MDGCKRWGADAELYHSGHPICLKGEQTLQRDPHDILDDAANSSAQYRPALSLWAQEMKTILLCLLLCVAFPFIAAAADVSGKWSGSFTSENGDSASAYVILKQSDAAIAGSGGPDANDQWPGLHGTIDGNKVSFEVKSPDDGTVYNGTLVLSGDHLKGDVVFTMADGTSGKATLDLTRVTP